MTEMQVFGASGAVGSFLLARLRAAGAAAIACTSKPELPATTAGDPIRWRRLDLWRDQAPSTANVIISAGPLDALAHWLAHAQTPQLQRLVALSSMSIEAKRDAIDARERRIAASLAQSEMCLRELCDRRGVAWTILRPTLIWGAGIDLSISALYRLARRYRIAPMPISLGGLRQPVHADDVAQACLLALSRNQSAAQTIALGGAERLPVAVMWQRVIHCAAASELRLPLALLRAASVLLGPRGTPLRATLGRWQQVQIAGSEAAHELLDWRPRGFDPDAEDFEPRSARVSPAA